jgi:hypothetical protein
VLREIQPTLGPGAQGPDVANLQEALVALGDSGYFRSSDPPIPYEPPPPPGGPTLQPTPDQLSQFLKVVADRRRFQTYESATETVVAWFQAQAGLTDPPGVVEAATAKRLNVELRESRLFPEGVQHSIVGQVRQRPSGTPLPDILVRASLLTGRVILRLGETRTDAAGAYARFLVRGALRIAVGPVALGGSGCQSRRRRLPSRGQSYRPTGVPVGSWLGES